MYHVGNMKSSSLRALFLIKVFTSDSQRGIASWGPRKTWLSDHVFAPLGKKRFAPNAQPAPARSCSKGFGDAALTSKWVIPARSQNDPFSQSVYHSALLATYVRPRKQSCRFRVSNIFIETDFLIFLKQNLNLSQTSAAYDTAIGAIRTKLIESRYSK